jgi:hypothetical protein
MPMHQQIPGPEQNAARLLRLVLDRNKTHARPLRPSSTLRWMVRFHPLSPCMRVHRLHAIGHINGEGAEWPLGMGSDIEGLAGESPLRARSRHCAVELSSLKADAHKQGCPVPRCQ